MMQLHEKVNFSVDTVHWTAKFNIQLIMISFYLSSRDPIGQYHDIDELVQIFDKTLDDCYRSKKNNKEDKI